MGGGRSLNGITAFANMVDIHCTDGESEPHGRGTFWSKALKPSCCGAVWAPLSVGEGCVGGASSLSRVAVDGSLEAEKTGGLWKVGAEGGGG